MKDVNTFTINKKQCNVYCVSAPEIILIQPVDDHETTGLNHQVDLIKKELKASFMLTTFKIEDWNQELSPWSAPAVFGPEPFGSGASETLGFITKELLPFLISQYSLNENIPVILGGYSLAGLFALWSAYQTDIFSAAAAVSPSVWFPGWIKYIETHKCRINHVYLSLGDKEEKTRNRVMAEVGNCIRTQQRVLSNQNISNILEWNIGNHFKDPDGRCAKGFIWCMKSVIV